MLQGRFYIENGTLGPTVGVDGSVSVLGMKERKWVYYGSNTTGYEPFGHRAFPFGWRVWDVEFGGWG